MRPFDLFRALLNAEKGIIRGTERNNGVILYGRINDRIVPIPEAILSKHQSTIENNAYSVFAFDIFAYQNSGAVYAADGRIAVLLPSATQTHQTTAVACKLYFLRGSTASLSVESNMVLGCFFGYERSTYVIKPAEFVTSEEMHIQKDECAIFREKLINPDRFESAMFPFPRRLGVDCPLLTHSINEVPAFYALQGDSLVEIRSLLQLRDMTPDSHLAECYSDWTVSQELLRYLDAKEAE